MAGINTSCVPVATGRFELAAAATGHALDLLAHELFHDPRQILIQPLLQHRMKKLARQIVDAALAALAGKHLLGETAEGTRRHVARLR